MVLINDCFHEILKNKLEINLKIVCECVYKLYLEFIMKEWEGKSCISSINWEKFGRLNYFKKKMIGHSLPVAAIWPGFSMLEQDQALSMQLHIHSTWPLLQLAVICKQRTNWNFEDSFRSSMAIVQSASSSSILLCTAIHYLSWFSLMTWSAMPDSM